MNKTVLTTSVIIAAALVFSVYLNTEGKRYHMETANKLLYKLDRKTGMLWLIFGGQAKPIGTPAKEPGHQSESEKAISLAKSSKALGGGHTVGDAVKRYLQNKKGLLKIHGWKAEKKKEKVYLVSYQFTDNSEENGFYFEVNLVAGIIRSVLGDEALEKEYGLKELGDKNRHRVLNNILSRQPHKEGI